MPFDVRRTRWVFRALFFTMMMSVGLMLPFFILHLKSEVGFDDRQIGMVSAISGLTVVLFHQLWGYVGDVLASKRLLVAFNCFAAALAGLWLGSTHTLPSTLAAMFVFSFFFSSQFQLLHGLVLGLEGGDVRFGGLRAWASFGYVVTNLVVGWYCGRVGSYSVIFPVMAAVNLVAMALVLAAPEGKRFEVREDEARRPRFLDVQAHFLRRGDVRLFLFVAFLHNAAHGLSYTLQAVLLKELGAGPGFTGAVYSFAAALEIPVFGAATLLLRRFGAVPMLVFASVVQAARWMVVWGAPNKETVFAAAAAHCVTFGVFYAASVAYINGHAGPRYRASGQTLLAMVYAGMAGVASNLLGGLAVSGGPLAPMVRGFATGWLGLPDRGDLRNMYVACAAVSTMAAIAGLMLWRMEAGTGDEVALGKA